MGLGTRQGCSSVFAIGQADITWPWMYHLAIVWYTMWSSYNGLYILNQYFVF